MTTLLYILLGVYLFLGVLISFAVTAFGTGVSGRPLEGRDLVLAVLIVPLWLPYIIWKVLCFLGIFFIPMSWQNKLGILSGKPY